jgi:putative hemolysin
MFSIIFLLYPRSEYVFTSNRKNGIRKEIGKMKNVFLTSCLVLLFVFAALLTGCLPKATPQPTEPSVGIANPASENCVKLGGTLSIQKNGSGGEYGICIFEDNLQCEEWAMFRGDCPVGGIKITGYITPAAVYCAISGGEYNISGESNTDN